LPPDRGAFVGVVAGLRVLPTSRCGGAGVRGGRPVTGRSRVGGGGGSPQVTRRKDPARKKTVGHDQG
jgi:hypothetical protein